jgi:hypothetical protein
MRRREFKNAAHFPSGQRVIAPHRNARQRPPRLPAWRSRTPQPSNNTIYNLLARHGWRKLMPRPFHPKRNVAAQNAFKKTAFQMLSGKPGGSRPDAVAACAFQRRRERVWRCLGSQQTTNGIVAMSRDKTQP